MVLKAVLNSVVVVAILVLAPVATANEVLPSLTNDPFTLTGRAALSGDFDGDGRRDDVVVVRDQLRDRLDIRVRLNRITGLEDIKVTSVSAQEGYSLRVAGAETFKRDCGDAASHCATEPLTAPHDSVLVSLDSGMDVLLYWNGTVFEQDFVSSDEVLMRRALSALLAVEK